jgi:hypothetical protein
MARLLGASGNAHRHDARLPEPEYREILRNVKLATEAAVARCLLQARARR